MAQGQGKKWPCCDFPVSVRAIAKRISAGTFVSREMICIASMQAFFGKASEAPAAVAKAMAKTALRMIF
ncbi:hypothetical protein L1065_07935 [Nereida sp. MMG024]|nr:hypothetical protein [Nereida sp. MMG025]